MNELTVRAVNIAVLGFCSIAALIMMLSLRKSANKSETSRIFFAKIAVTFFTLVCYTISFIVDESSAYLLFVLTRSIAYVGFYAICYLYVLYLKAQINGEDRNKPVSMGVVYGSLVISVVGALLWVLSVFGNVFTTMGDPSAGLGPYFIVAHLGIILLIAISLCLLVLFYKKLGILQALVLSSMPLLLLAAILLEPFANGIELRYPCIMIEFLIVYTQHHIELENKAEKYETENLKNRLNMAAGRIKPHYLYNVLTTIYYLCESDPSKAQSAVATFSEYLRSILNAMEKQDLVKFDWELGEIRHYLTLEKLRFGDRLHVEYDVEVEDFMIPPLSVEPLVENAVKHGIAAKEEGGTVRIVTRRLSDGGSQVRIIDDGVGFDIANLRGLDATHEGVANVRERIRLECGGDMTITSAPGKGTTAMITLRPQEKEGNIQQ